MIIADEEILYSGTVYHIVGAEGDTEEEYLYFAQPRDSKMKSQYMHDNALDELFEREEDLRVFQTCLEPDEPEQPEL